MADKKISLVIEAKNMLDRGLASAKQSLSKFTSGMNSLRSSFMGLLAGVGVFQAIKTAFSEFAQAEKATRNLADAMKMHGEAADVALPKLKRIAAQMQEETAIDGDVYLQRMANLSIMGLTADKLEVASKAVQALTRAGMGEEAAQRAVYAAMQGNYESLTRYVPQLKTANNEVEKAAIVNKYLSDQWAAQKKDLDTAEGGIRSIKLAFLDLAEVAGRAITSPALGIGNWIKEKVNVATDFYSNMLDGIEAREKKQSKKTTAKSQSEKDAIKATEEAAKQEQLIIANAAEAEKAAKEKWLKEQEEIRIRDLESEERFEKEMEQVWKEEEHARKEAEDKARKLEEDKTDLKEKEADIRKQISDDETDTVLRGWEKQRDEAEKIAGETVANFIKASRERRKEEQGFSEEDKKAARLSKFERAGTRLSKKDREWLDAFNAIRGAREQAGIAKENIANIEAKKQTTHLSDIETMLQKNLEKQNELGMFGGG